MGTSLKPVSEVSAIATVKPANEQRGRNYVETALCFIREYSIGDVLSADKFDRWAHTNGYIEVPFDAARQSDAWKAHLMRRHELKQGINKAGAHPRMRTRGETPFVIVVVGDGVWEVRAPEVAIATSTAAQRLETLTRTQRRELGYLMESADWTALPPWERAFAEEIYADIGAIEEDTCKKAERIGAKIHRLKNRLSVLVGRGVPGINHGGVAALIAGDDTEEQE